MWRRRLLRGIGLSTLLVAAGSSAQAHPHVWITVGAEIVYSADGLITAVRQVWTFDPGFSAYQTQGLGSGGYPPRRAELEKLAKDNAEALGESGYYTLLEADGVKQEFDSAREYRMLFTGGQLTFTFLAPLKRPAAASEVTLQFHDATFFASFSLPEGAVTLTKAPKGCTGTLSLPKSRQGASQKTLVNTLNEALSAGGSPEPSSSRFTVTCLDQVAPAGYTQPVAPALDGPYPVFGATGSMLTLLRVLVSLLVAALVWSVVAVRRPGAP